MSDKNTDKAIEVEEITCKQLTLKGDNGSCIELSFSKIGKPYIAIKPNSEKNAAITLTLDDNGGFLAVFGNDGYARICLGIADDDVGYVLRGTKYVRSDYVPAEA